MPLKLSTWLLLALTGGALLAGCGSSSSTSSSQTTPAVASPGTRLNAQQAVARCTQAIQAQPTISASAKARLKTICGKAATGDPTVMHHVAQAVCIELVNALHVPAGVARARALAVCKAP
jgi:hypothetical protein